MTQRTITASAQTHAHGTLTDYQTGQMIRPATREELLRSIASGPEGAMGIERDGTGRSVYVDRSHDELDDDVRALRAEAATAGDQEMVTTCNRYLDDGDEDALAECATVMLEACPRAE